jgi:CheY-like chemotaxis protein
MSKIVIVEDNELIAKLYENKLQAEGHTVFVASDGERGLEVIRSIKPDLVLTDIMLPNLSGIELIKNLRRDYKFTNLPIVAYTGADDDLLEEAREANPTRLISKRDFSLREILAHLHDVLETSRQWQIYDPMAFDAGEENGNREENSHKRILIVEDDLIVSTIVKDIVEKENCEAVTTDNGQEALCILAKDGDFAAAVFDIEVPKIKGRICSNTCARKKN